MAIGNDRHDTAVPVIDLGISPVSESDSDHGSGAGRSDVWPPPSIVEPVGAAAERFGFFQVVGHGIDAELIDQVWDRTRAFFRLPIEEKRRLLRTKENTRGYYDRELTKNARDLKEVLDIAHVPFPELADDDRRNLHAVDGRNQWPDLDGFRSTMVAYLQACERLSLSLLEVFCVAMGEAPDRLRRNFGSGAADAGTETHTSFVRLNHYPLQDPLSAEEAEVVTPLGDMALHHHSDAGALTVLLQDQVGGLQVADGDRWLDVEPIPGALVINTGDMMQVWSNDRFTAALHRVAPRTAAQRYSLPYFFNPTYSTDYAPLPGMITSDRPARYETINWGRFRQARADGDFADYGAEVQISDFRI